MHRRTCRNVRWKFWEICQSSADLSCRWQDVGTHGRNLLRLQDRRAPDKAQRVTEVCMAMVPWHPKLPWPTRRVCCAFRARHSGPRPSTLTAWNHVQGVDDLRRLGWSNKRRGLCGRLTRSGNGLISSGEESCRSGSGTADRLRWTVVAKCRSTPDGWGVSGEE